MKRVVGFLFILFTSLTFYSCQQSQCPTGFMKPHEEGLLRVSIDNDLSTMDPRRVRDLNTMTFMRMFYEGLVRAKSDGTYEPAVAEKIEVSDDGKVYTIKLKETFWTNGERVEANDFIYAWKSMLTPGFPAPNAYQLYPIKNAQAIKDGKEFVDALGVFEKNKTTLVIELEHAHPEFMQLLSTPFYYPVNYQWAKDYDDSPHTINPGEVPLNGPFVPKSWHQQESLVAAPNPTYWDAKAVKLKKVEFIYSDNNTALQMFKQDGVDWVGSPLSTLPMDALAALKKENCVKIVPADGMFFIRMNTAKPPFTNANIRRGFSQAIDRKSIVENITLAGQPPSTSLVPTNYGLGSTAAHEIYDPSRAASDFARGLKELGLQTDTFPPVTLSYVYSDRNHKIAQTLQRQWKTLLGIDVSLPPSEAKVTMDQIRRGDYMMAIGSWFADIHDPINYLDVFKYKNNGTNNTGWENAKYIEALEKSTTVGTDERKKSLAEAESILLQEMPIVPLFEATFSYMQKPRVEGVYLSPLGYMDFKYASVAKYADDFPPKGD
ncbi:MAG: peptide ABC transporter substrate-binding protein [Parachlamydiales bacterium]|jgi:oligopeptide transport system substrate-binding protein